VVDDAVGSTSPDGGVRATLYGPAGAPFTEKVRRGLLFKRIPFELVEPTGPEDYRRWNPETGLLPVLEIGDERIADSTSILVALDERYPEPPFLSSDPRVGGQQSRLEDWADENLLFYFNKWLQIRDANDREEALRRTRPATAWRRLAAWLRAGGTWERPETAVVRGVGDRLDDLVGFLGTRPFFYSNRVSMADLGVYAMLYSLSLEMIPGTRQLVTNRAPLLDFMRRVEIETGDDAEVS
jgi:glutathione S-transferase